MIVNCEFFKSSQSIDLQSDLEHILLHGTGSTITIVKFAVSLKHNH